jgi:hypothetical protein
MGGKEMAMRLRRHANSARRRAETERADGNADACIFLSTIATALEDDAARAARMGQWNWRVVRAWAFWIAAALVMAVSVYAMSPRFGRY